MNIFEIVKAAVTVRDAAEHYGLRVSRNYMVCCPFHNDRHPSVKLNEDYFYCFGCGAKGDVIDFVARLFDLTSLQAVQKLAYDFGIDPDKPPAAAAWLHKNQNTHWQESFKKKNCTASGYCAISCTFWNAGRCSMYPGHQRKPLMTVLWKPVKCSTIPSILQTF